ncbi:MAG TPA: hypothetical protein DEV81_14515 [Cyanobacteria bacterium UBA11049]|nr:hypothetical protein [Cyanobacteria bacterium UBA11049]
MAVIRLFLLLVVLGCLTLLLVQNWSPVLPLVFLGARTQPLPLAIWILFSIAAGAITSLFISGCFKLSNYFTPSQPRKRRQVAASSFRSNTTRAEAPKSSQANYTTSTSQPNTDSTPTEDLNDWESNSSDDWDFEQETQVRDKTPRTEPQDTVREDKNYQVNNEPKSSYRDSSYSYSYREPSNSGVGRTESIYDADYRVLTPPHRQTNTTENKNQNQDDWKDEDWGFEDDEDWGFDDKESPRPRRD